MYTYRNNINEWAGDDGKETFDRLCETTDARLQVPERKIDKYKNRKRNWIEKATDSTEWDRHIKKSIDGAKMCEILVEHAYCRRCHVSLGMVDLLKETQEERLMLQPQYYLPSKTPINITEDYKIPEIYNDFYFNNPKNRGILRSVILTSEGVFCSLSCRLELGNKRNMFYFGFFLFTAVLL